LVRRPARSGASRTRRARCLRAELEWLEGRSLLSATSAISWVNGGVTHSALYAIDKNDSIEVSVDGGGFTNLGGYARQISTGIGFL
jgi:hypothetical protein